MRLTAFLLGVLLIGAGAYLTWGLRTSYRSYSEGQLQTLAAAMARASAGGNDATRSVDVSASLLRDEMQRRRYRTPLWLGGLGLIALSLVLPKRERREDAGEAERLSAYMSATPPPDMQARARAAELLGVAPDAPASVVEAAYQAQCRERDRSRYDGVAPDLARMAEHQLQELAWARNLLLGQRPSPPAGP